MVTIISTTKKKNKSNVWNERKEEATMNDNVNAQVLGFDPVLITEHQVPVLKKEDSNWYLQIKAPQANKVSFIIEEKEYQCEKNEEGIWSVCYNITKAIQYVQLRIDEVDVITPLLPITYGYSRPYNYIAIEKEEETYYKIQDVPHGSVRREYFFSKVTNRWESCMVYTPYCYEEQLEKEFPVLYLQHGHGENEIGWTASGKVNFIADNLIAQKSMTPMIIVMSNGMVQTEDENGNRMVDFKQFETQLLQDIIPYIEQKFRVKKEKEARAIAGLSMGSIQATTIAFYNPQYFHAVGVFSGFITDWIQGSVLDMVKREASKNEHLNLLEDEQQFSKHFSVFFRAMGDKDPFFDYFLSDDTLLEEKNIEHIRKIYSGTHDWNVWRMCIRDFLPLIFK